MRPERIKWLEKRIEHGMFYYVLLQIKGKNKKGS